ncbi:cytochrome C biogenesis protein CcmF [Bradyrhizobium nanningense]|uniref:Cytochrome C biogenesis protein CcmF n=1 Tax=Bradyrhizobium nanningense TaxID=1325118 RepID=A0A4Q0RZ68_9BRAD|nr:heme lyase CcmF/NrfE family subunit [Bradyrhizobium nanningense]RXH24185.1 cytochrome C biogenesis protein CcmF [Bradyrhizobium nanningense]RXH29259.1 cytochrome C biogenesis protein CcmF [Bradyrhizobium nanningense]
MIVETGHYALALALAVTLLQSVLPLWGTRTGDSGLASIAVPAAITQFLLLGYAFAALTYAHVVSDFSLVTVAENSLTTKPLVYKIAGVWGNHEGSMLLWVLILAAFGAAVAVLGRGMRKELRADTLAVQGWISLAFLCFILFTSDPFARRFPAPIEGLDLNPLLQDPGLAIHPPLLYLGYVGSSIVFSFAVAALIGGRLDAAWARYVRPWILIAWIFLTLGIAMGSYWAYYTLGWGGFWFWDPVENASLMPWLAGSALLHSAAVMEKREALKNWTLFLAIVTFSLSLLGTFLVRSGVLTSVHSFASDPARGVFILIILTVFIGGSLSLYAWRAPSLSQRSLFAPISRESVLVANNLLLTTCCATVLTGTLYPLALEALTGDKISVGAPFFNLTLAPLVALIVLLMPLGQSLAWKRGDLLGAAQRVTVAALGGLLVALVLVAVRGGPVLAAVGLGLALYLIVGSFADVASRVWARGQSARVMLARAVGLPRSAWGVAIVHAGFGVTLMGLAATGWGVERIATVELGHGIDLGPYHVTIENLRSRQGPNYSEVVANTVISRGGAAVATVAPSKRSFPARQTAVTEAGIVTLGFGQIYISLGDQHPDGSIDARMFWKPLVTAIWIGAVIMAFGGIVSLSDRRLRIGFARRAATVRSVANPAAPQAAE